MSPIRTAVHKLLGLFVDDGWLAAATLSVIVFTGAIRVLLPASPMLAGTILVFGCLGVLVRSVLGGVQK
jgi:hypothetical protein